MSEDQAARGVHAQMKKMIDEQVEALREMLTRQADAMIEHMASVALSAAGVEAPTTPGREQAATQLILKPADVREALGGISKSRYYEIVDEGLLPYTRLSPGGNRVHLPEHLEQYREYLAGQTKGGEKTKARGKV